MPRVACQAHAMPSWLSAARYHTLLVVEIQASTLIRIHCKSWGTCRHRDRPRAGQRPGGAAEIRTAGAAGGRHDGAASGTECQRRQPSLATQPPAAVTAIAATAAGGLRLPSRCTVL